VSAPAIARPSAVVLDLFGTLVAAPSAAERTAAATQFARILRVGTAVVDAALTNSWPVRHDGRLRSTVEVAAHLVACCGASPSRAGELAQLMAGLARVRLQADASLLPALEDLRSGGVRLVLPSDASADIAEAWARSDLAPYFDAAVFSCLAGAVKPAPQLFRAALEEVGIAPYRALYCGDGGGDELAGAERAGMCAVRVARRGGPAGLAFGEIAWTGASIREVEALPSLLNGWRDR
jgi:putative hydrolase of the HAD superfamily